MGQVTAIKAEMYRVINGQNQVILISSPQPLRHIDYRMISESIDPSLSSPPPFSFLPGLGLGADLGGFAWTATVLDDVIVVLNKADLLDPQTEGHEEEGSSLVALVEEASSKRGEGKGKVWKLSCKTREGLEEFVGHLEAVVGERFQGATDDESPLITR